MVREDPSEFDVGVSFYGADFVLTILWTTDETVNDEVRAAAAADWFLDTYGFDPALHARDVRVEPLPPPRT